MGVNQVMLVVFPLDFARQDTGGLREKAVGLLRAAQEWGLACAVAYQWNGDLQIADLEAVEKLPTPYLDRTWRAVLHQHHGFWRKLSAHIKDQRYCCIWIRLGVVTPAQLGFVRRRNVPVYLEIPTFPFRHERGIGSGLLADVTRPLLMSLARSARVVISPTSAGERILDRPTVPVQNGVDLQSINLCSVDVVQDIPFRLVGLGQWSPWHGIDRLIRGIARAELQNSFIIELAGDGAVVRDWQQLARISGVRLIKHPYLFGAARQKLLDRAHAGIGTLATHRRRLQHDSSLKQKLYLAAGLPFMVTERDDSLPDHDGILRIIDDDSALDAHSLQKWVRSMVTERELIRRELRKIAQTFAWSQTYAAFFELLWREHFRESLNSNE